MYDIIIHLICIFHSFLSYFFVKKIPLRWRVECVMGCGQVSESVSQWVSASVCELEIYVHCISHQSDWIYYKQPIKFLVVKVNGMWEDLILIRFGMTKYFSFYKRGSSIHILGLHRHFLWVRLRILVMDEMSLEVWNSMWTSGMQMRRDTFIFSYKGNLILLFFTKSKFN